jgi:hypothetical protein
MTLAEDLPPINDIEAIFDHLTSRVSQSAVTSLTLADASDYRIG